MQDYPPHHNKTDNKTMMVMTNQYDYAKQRGKKTKFNTATWPELNKNNKIQTQPTLNSLFKV